MTVGSARALILAVWAAFFVWLLWSGEVYRYIGPRTYWVVIFGSIALAVTALGYVWLLMARETDALEARSLGTLALLLIPIVLVVLIPSPNLGSLAASRKLTGGSTAAFALEPNALGPGEEVTFQDLANAARSSEYGTALGLTDGYEVDVIGFISDAETGVADALALTRFSIFCCAADAVPYTIPVLATGGATYPRDSWVRVQGAAHQREGSWVVEAERVTEVDEPANPYV
jgi:uncharacterized repeat protein (TIGR03943 family)